MKRGARDAERDVQFEDFVRTHRPRLLGTATMLTGGDRPLAEDLVQTSLVRVYLAWDRAAGGNPYGYTRKTLVSAFIDHRRRPMSRREHSLASPGETTAAPANVETTLDPSLMEALKQLPHRMRAAVVLRHVYELSVEETSEAMGCRPGTVKSQTARGLSKLRDALAADTATLGSMT